MQIEELVRLEERKSLKSGLLVSTLTSCVSSSVAFCRCASGETGGRACRKSASCVTNTTCIRSTSVWIPARRGIRHRYRLHVPTYEDECEANPSVDRDKIMVPAAARTVSAVASSLTTAASMPRWRCAKTVMRLLWSTVTRKPSLPTTTHFPTVCTSSR